MYIHKVNPRLLNPCIYCSPSLTNVQPGETRLNQVWYCWALSESSAKVGVETCSAISVFPAVLCVKRTLLRSNLLVL